MGFRVGFGSQLAVCEHVEERMDCSVQKESVRETFQRGDLEGTPDYVILNRLLLKRALRVEFFIEN